MERETKKRLKDILDAIGRIDIHVSKVNSIFEYKKDVTVKGAVERDLATIGEAIVQIKKVHPAIQITAMQKIISFRNLIIHSYDSVNDETVWLTVKRHIPILKTEVEELLNT